MARNRESRREARRIRQENRSKVGFGVGSGIVGFGAIMVCMFALLVFTKTSNPASLFYAAFVLLVAFGVPPLIDFLKAAALKGMDKEELGSADWDESRERIENLEALICRLDAEINSQLEHAVSSGKFTTVETAGNSQLPTAFLNISTALEKRFQILKELGRGGMGIVFQAYDKQLKEQVAIKILSPLLSTNSEALERLKREVSAARRVTHRNVIRIHDISESEGLHFVSMEYFSGTTLRNLLKRDGMISPAMAAQIAFQICDGLESAHQQGVIHRDLKSQNVIVNDTGDLKIIDFGLASCSHQEGMTATGLIMGTPEYMAPEQVAGKKADERADIYSLGIILYEVFTGKVPFTADSAIAVGFLQMREDPIKPSDINPKISPALEQVILRALQKDPADRYDSVNQMRSDLQKALGQSVPSPSGLDVALKTNLDSLKKTE